MLDGDRLGNAIVDAIIALNTAIDETEETRLRLYWKAIAAEIVTEIQDNAVVTVTGVSTGAGTANGTVD